MVVTAKDNTTSPAVVLRNPTLTYSLFKWQGDDGSDTGFNAVFSTTVSMQVPCMPNIFRILE